MRKIVWCCTAVLVLAVVAACLTTQYASYHPDSLVGRCVITGLRLVAAYDPAIQVGQAAARSVHLAERAVLAVPTTTGLVPGDSQEPAHDTEEAHACPPADPVPATQDEPEATAPEENGERVPAEKIVIQPDPEETAPAPAAGAAEEAELPPSVMPHAEAEPAPERMPYAEDEEETEEVQASPIDFWYGLLQEAMAHCTDAGSQEECEHGAATQATHEGGHCPICPYTGRCTHCEHGNSAAGTQDEQPASDEAEEEGTTPDVKLPQKHPGARKTASPPGSDTQEFRPSDANPGDFESIPY